MTVISRLQVRPGFCDVHSHAISAKQAPGCSRFHNNRSFSFGRQRRPRSMPVMISIS
jgi:hypothetical protein